MKYAKKTKKTVRRRTYKRRVPRTVALRSNANVGKGFPQKMTMTHKFFHNGTLTNTAGTPSTIATELFYCNGMTSPVQSGVTHQPMYFDQMMAVYRNYTVIGSKIKIKFINNGQVDDGAIVCCFQNDSNTAIVPTLMSSLVEQSKGKYRVLDAGANAPIRDISMKWSAKKYYGGSILANNDIMGNFFNNPVVTPSWGIALQDLGATNSETVSYTAEVEYIAVWYAMRDIGGS